jgi:hypothetical protein
LGGTPRDLGQIRLFPTQAELWRIINPPGAGKTELERQLARALREMGPAEVNRTNNIGELAAKVQRHMEVRVGDYRIKPDLETIGKGLLDLLGIRL